MLKVKPHVLEQVMDLDVYMEKQVTRPDTLRIDGVTYYVLTCEYCGRLHHSTDRRRRMHLECYSRLRLEKPSKASLQLLEYLEGFTVPVRERDIVEDLGMPRGQVWKAGDRLVELGYAIRDNGYMLNENGKKFAKRRRLARL